MNVKRPISGLGRGLSALMGEAAPAPADEPPSQSRGGVREIEIGRIRPNPNQPRMHFSEESIDELADSIGERGVLQPILLRPHGDGFEIIAGERRVRAARLAGLDSVPVLVRDVSDEAAAAMALIENIQREDLNPLEEARGLSRLTDEFGMTHEAAARAVGRSRSAASNLLRLLNLTEPVQQLLLAGDLDMGHARALLSLTAAEQIQCGNEIVARKLSVRDAEKLVTARQTEPGRQAPLLRTKRQKGRDLVRIEQQLSDQFAAAVEIRVKKRTAQGDAGEIAIAFGSMDELNGLLARLGHEGA